VFICECKKQGLQDISVSFISIGGLLLFFHSGTNALEELNVPILVSFQHNKVPLLQGDAVDHD